MYTYLPRMLFRTAIKQNNLLVVFFFFFLTIYMITLYTDLMSMLQTAVSSYKKNIYSEINYYLSSIDILKENEH